MPDSSELKTCSACLQVKSIGDFYLQSRNPSHPSYNKPHSKCKSCVIKRNGEYQRKNYDPEKYRRWRLWKVFGITPEDYDRMLAEQDGQCAICRRPPQGGRWNVLAIDHCHRTGRVRGLLCSPCNKGVGAFQDNVSSLRKAADYVLRDRNAR